MITQKRAQWRSLAGGELSEEMYGRVDLPRHSIGLKRCYNAIVTPQGAVTNRAGSRFISQTNDNLPAWLVPFVRSDGQGFLLEFTDSNLRVVGAGNVVGAEPDPGDIFTVTSVDIWTIADGYPITAAVFTTDSPHGFSPGDEVNFQGFSLVNPDQAGINKLAAFMNVTWYVATTPTTTTFTITSVWPIPVGGQNLGFEDGLNGWTFDADDQDYTKAADTNSPVVSGASLKVIGSSSDDAYVRAVNNARLPVVRGQQVSWTASLECIDRPTETRLDMRVHWFNAAGNLLSISYLAADATLVSGVPRIIQFFGLAGQAADGVFEEVTMTATAPSGAAYWTPVLVFNWLTGGGWAVDSISTDYLITSWSDFSGAPYNGLINGGTATPTADVPVLSITPTYTQSHIRFASYAQFVDDLVFAHKLYPTSKLTRVSDNEWTFTELTFNAALAAPANIAVTAEGTPGSDPITYTYTVTTVNDAGAESAIGTADGDDNTLRTLGNFNSIAWDTVSGVFRFNVYKDVGGQVYGYIGSSTGTSFVDDNISPDYLKQPPAVLATFDALGLYAGTVCFYEQRMTLGGTVSEPQAFWVSGLPAFDYFKASVPPQDDQAFTYELSSAKAAPILHSLPTPELLFFTSAGVQRVISIDGEVFGPTTVAQRNASSYGAHELAKPQEAGTNVLYPVERGGHLYQMKPTDSLTGYDVEDLSVIAAHLIDNKDWVQTAFRRAPFPIWFGLRDDGLIVALTYMPEQQVFAWHQHELPGAFVESIAVVPEGKVDALYVVARRTILDETVRYIERIEPRNFGTEQADAYFVDSGVTYRGPETDTVTGLDHLEGEEVMVLGDGRVSGPYTVDGGSITIDDLAEVIHVGLSYTTEIETLPLSYANAEGFGVGIMKNVSALWVRIKQSLGFTAGPTFDEDDQRPLVDDAEELLGDAPELRDGVHDITMLGVWTQDSTVCIQQTQPLPLTITGLAADYVDGE